MVVLALAPAACGPAALAPPGPTGSVSTQPISGSRPNAPLTLARADRACFYAPSPAGGWPFLRHTGIRSSFNEPRGPVHFGVDVAAATDRAPVYAIDSGVVSVANHGHFNVLDVGRSHEFSYWHVSLEPGIHVRTRLHQGQLVGHIWHNFFHVHIAEWAHGCGFVDPRRPTGIFHDPRNTERPAIGALTAYVANAAAWALPDRPVQHLDRRPGDHGLRDPAQPLSLDDLHGTVDLRAQVLDVPRVGTPVLPQIPLAPSVVRGWLAPVGDPQRHFGPLFQWSGATYMQAGPAPTFPALGRLWAFGTWRSNACLFHPGDPAYYCGMHIIYHVGGPHGFDTRPVKNGRYDYCVAALTINNVPATRCTAVTIKN